MKRKPAIACPRCGGIRNVTNVLCAKCYMREYRWRQIVIAAYEFERKKAA